MSEPKYKPLIIGHRGAMGYETENTVASIKKALEFQVDAIEIDVYKIKSGELVVFHDDNLKRLAGIDAPIENYTLTELQHIVIEGGHSIPTLQEILDVIDKKCRFNIELKGANTATDTYYLIHNYMIYHGWKETDFIISSFRWDELATMRSLDAKMPLAVLVGDDPLNALETAKKLKAEAINPHFSKLTPENVKTIHKQGFKIYTWTVNEPKDIERMKKLKVEGLITNYPDRVLPD